MQVIYSNTCKVEMWSIHSFITEVITYITKHHFLFFSWYKIHQNNPKIQSCFYDGEFSSNSRLESIMDSEKAKAQLWLSNYKQQNIINYEKD